MNTENSKANESHKFIFNLSQRLDQTSSNKQVTLQNLLIYCAWKNIRKQFKSNKPKLIAPTWNDELPGGSYSVSDIQDYLVYIIKKHETLTRIPPICNDINRNNNRLVFSDEYKQGLQTLETVKLFCSTKN